MTLEAPTDRGVESEDDEDDLPDQAIMPQLKQKSATRKSEGKGAPTAAAAESLEDMGGDSADEVSQREKKKERKR
jgi:hypothetical protein